MRTQDEIVARIAEIETDAEENDWMGFRREVLIGALDYAHAQPYLKPDVTAQTWDGRRDGDLHAAALSYYEFAVGKIRDHRGISASRSVDKLREYAWLLGREDAVAAMDAVDYAPYGAPQVKAWADAFDQEWPAERWAVRMAEGLPCQQECQECGQ